VSEPVKPPALSLPKPPRPIVAGGPELRTAAEATLSFDMDGTGNGQDTVLQLTMEATPRSEWTRKFLRVMLLVAKKTKGGQAVAALEAGEDGRVRVTVYTKCLWGE